MPLFVIYSNMSLVAIREFLLSHGKESQIGHIRVNYDKDGLETNLSIASLENSLYDNLVRNGVDRRKPGIDFAINKYRLNEKNRPSLRQTASFYIPVPNTLTESQVIEHIGSRLNRMVDFGDLPSKGFRIIVPKVSRDNGQLKGIAFVTFRHDIPIETIALCRTIIDGSTWESTWCRCLWAQKRNNLDIKDQPKERKVE